jgi:flavin reductase (DIM6/NTAB) family NADH-FMN oxidoreductase RutF
MSTIETSPLARALGRIPSGLYVVTTLHGDEPIGFVGSFVMQMGFDPPTVCMAVGKTRTHLADLRECGHFTLSILDKHASGLMSPFFRKLPDGASPFESLRLLPTSVGSPVLADALAWVACRVVGEHATGDHVAVFGHVVEGALLRDGEPTCHLRKNGLGY